MQPVRLEVIPLPKTPTFINKTRTKTVIPSSAYEKIGVPSVSSRRFLCVIQQILFVKRKNRRLVLKKTLNFMAPFYRWGSTASRLEPLRGGSLLFTTKSPEISGTHFIDLGRMKDWVDLGATERFWTRDPWIGDPAP